MTAFFITVPNVDWRTHEVLDTKYTVLILKPDIGRKDYIGQTFKYAREDGYTATVVVKKVSSEEADNLRKTKKYDTTKYEWIVDSILEHGKIISPKEFAKDCGTEQQKNVLLISEMVTSGRPNKRYTELEDVRLHEGYLRALIEKGLLSEDDEVYTNGPTIRQLLPLMHEAHSWDGSPYLCGNYYSDRFFFTKLFGNTIPPETEAKFDKMFKRCYKDKYREDGAAWYFNN